MVNVYLNIVALISGIIGSVIGIASLVWHIKKSKPRLRLEKAYFVKGGFGTTVARGHSHVGVRLTLRNVGHRSVTIEDLDITIGNCSQGAPFFKPITIDASSSKKLEYELMFSDKNFRSLYHKGKLEFRVFIIHTFGKIRKVGTTDFRTGHFTIS